MLSPARETAITLETHDDGRTTRRTETRPSTRYHRQRHRVELACQLEMRGYRVDPDEEDNHHSYVRFGASDDIIADILGDEVATVTNR
jgi:hypothetical protein